MATLEFKNEEYDWANITLMDYLLEGNIPSGWKEVLTRPEIVAQLELISEQIQIDQKRFPNAKIYPAPNQVFRALSLPPQKVKAIILGKEPYHDGTAVGLAFSMPSGHKLTPTLENIYDELDHCGFVHPRTGDLSHWHQQGCLMLNTALTVVEGRPESHLDLWKPITNELIKYMGHYRKAVWLMMGSYAHKYCDMLDQSLQRQVAIQTSHPSPLSFQHGSETVIAFQKSNCFNWVNKYIEERLDDPPMKW